MLSRRVKYCEIRYCCIYELKTKYIKIYIIKFTLIYFSFDKNSSFTETKPSKDATNILHVKVTFTAVFCIINNINFCVRSGASYHNPS